MSTSAWTPVDENKEQNSAWTPVDEKTEEPSTYEKLTNPDDPAARAFDEKHPIAGKAVRFLSAAGGAGMALPEQIGHAVMHPIDTASAVGNSVGAWMDPKTRPTFRGAMSVLPEALGGATGAAGASELGAGALRMAPLGRVARTGGRILAETDLTKPFKAASQVPEFWRESSPEAVAHRAALRDPFHMQAQRAIELGKANPLPTRVSPQSAPIDPILGATKEAIAEGRASRVPTRLSPRMQALANQEPLGAPLGRGVVSGHHSAALGRINVNAPAGGELAEIPATPTPQAANLSELGLPAGERAAIGNFMRANPSALGRIGMREVGAPGRAGSMAENVGDIRGTLPAGRGRMVLTPEELAQQDMLDRIATRNASRRGMNFAGGMVPREGRSVPYRMRPNVTEEWRSLK